MKQVDLGRIVKKAMEEAVRERGHVNLLLVGRTGVGKSTLVNEVFQGRFAETGQGLPVTQATQEITKPGIPLTIFDTRGLELAAHDEIVSELEGLVVERKKDRDPNRHIHVAWLCIQEPGRRVEQAEIELCERLSAHVPVVAVITKCMNDAGFRTEVQRLLPHAVNVMRVRALAETLDDGHHLDPMGLESLVELTMDVVPEAHQMALVASQKASLDLKRRRSHAIVASAAAAAATAAATPIPFADAAILVPIQVGMIASISATFGLDVNSSFLTTLIASAAGTTGATFAGRTVLTSLLKFFPGAGTITGGALAAGTAASITTVLGEAYIQALMVAFRESGGEAVSTKQVREAFKQALKKGRKGKD